MHVVVAWIGVLNALVQIEFDIAISSENAYCFAWLSKLIASLSGRLDG